MSERLFDEVSQDVPSGASWQTRGQSRNLSARQSIFAGLGGLAFYAMCLAFLTPASLWTLDSIGLMNTRPSFMFEMMLVMSLILPPTVAASLLIASVMFWHIAIFVRYFIAVILFFPATVAFVAGFFLLENNADGQFVTAMTVLFTSGFSGAAVVGVALQMCTQWTLTPVRESGTPLRPIGISTLFQLTAIIAISIAFIKAVFGEVDEDLFWPAIIFCGFGAAGSLIGSLGCIAFLRDQKPTRRVKILAAIGAAAPAFILFWIFASLEFGWRSPFENLFLSIPTIGFGAVLVAIVMGIGLWWLRRCGWRCIVKSETRRAHEV